MDTAVLTLTDIEQLAWQALREHGLFDKGWIFRWDRAVTRLGLCNYSTKTISLSKKIYSLESNRDTALDTILHEVAHALCGKGAGHGPVWKATARRLGADPTRCGNVSEKPLRRLVGTCACGSIHGRDRVQEHRKYQCRRCHMIITWTKRGAMA